MKADSFPIAKATATLVLVAITRSVLAIHIPTDLDVPGLRTSLGSSEG